MGNDDRRSRSRTRSRSRQRRRRSDSSDSAKSKKRKGSPGPSADSDKTKNISLFDKTNEEAAAAAKAERQKNRSSKWDQSGEADAPSEQLVIPEIKRTFKFPCAPGRDESTGIRQAKLEIEDRFIRHIIGKQGEQVKKMMECGAQVVVSRNPSANGNWPMTITGQDLQVEAACVMVRQVLCKATLNTPNIDPPAGFFMEHKEIETWYCPQVMGPGGEKIAKLCQETCCEMEFRGKPTDKVRYLTMVGTKKNIKQACKMVDEDLGWYEDEDLPMDVIIPQTLEEAESLCEARVRDLGETSKDYAEQLAHFLRSYGLSDAVKNGFQMLTEELGKALLSGPCMHSWINRYYTDQATNLSEALLMELENHQLVEVRQSGVIARKIQELGTGHLPMGRAFIMCR